MTPAAAPASAAGLQEPDPLPGLQAEFSAFRIWREDVSGRVRYVAHSRNLRLPVHTVVTSDPDELRAVLAPVRQVTTAPCSAEAQVRAVPDGAPRCADPRVAAAAELLAERHQPSALSAAHLGRLLANYERRLRGLLDVVGADPVPRRSVQHLQALEDALKYRRARSSEPCVGCDTAPDGRCEDHGRDLDLISVYEQTARRLLADSTP
jgi:hypothetical protein